MQFIQCGSKSLDAHIAFTFEGEVKEALSRVDGKCFVSAKGVSPVSGFIGKKNEVVLIYGTEESPIPRLILVGLGKRDAYKNRCALRQCIREATGTAVRFAKAQKYMAVAFTESAVQEDAYKEKKSKAYEDIAYATEAGLYTFTMKTKDVEKNPTVYFCGLEEKSTPEMLEALALGERLGKASSFVRDLVNSPANIVNPEYMLAKAKDIAKEHSLKITVLDRKAITDKGMGAFASVAKGSDNEPYLIALEHCPKGKENEKPIAIVGKGLTFDSGGISIKPSNNMHEMKADMAGAGTALGLATLLTKCVDKHVVIVLACAENMPSSKATRPGDIVTTLSGKTVEILNTDAEGRLVLCDAITWVQNEFSPSTVIDMATLTGACVMALGEELTGLFTDDDILAEDFIEIGICVGQPAWRLPVMEDMFLEDIKSTVADLQNIGKSRFAGATTAGLFLKQFVQEGVRWAHLDIAGTAYSSVKNPLTSGGATGAPLLLLFKMLTEKL